MKNWPQIERKDGLKKRNYCYRRMLKEKIMPYYKNRLNITFSRVVFHANEI